MARAEVKVDVTGSAEFREAVARLSEAVATLTECARFAQSLRAHLIRLAFNPDHDAVLLAEEIEGRALHQLDKWHRTDAEKPG